MGQDHQADGIREDEWISLGESRSLHGWEHEERRPSRRRLRYRVDEHEHERSLRGGVSELGVDPSVQHTRHCHGRVRGHKAEPLGGFGNVPDGQDDQADAVPDVSNGDGPGWTPEEIRTEADEQGIEDSQGRGDGPELVHPRCRVSFETLEPEKIAATRSVDAAIPEEDVQQQQSPELPVNQDLLDRAERELFRRIVAVAGQTLHGEVDVLPLQYQGVGLVRGAREDQVAQDTDRDRDDRADDVHPSPARKTVGAIESGRCSCLNQAGS